MGELHIYVNFRSLNHHTQLDMLPIPRILDLLHKLGRAYEFFAIDLSYAYYEVHIKEGHEHCTAFLMPTDLYKYVMN